MRCRRDSLAFDFLVYVVVVVVHRGLISSYSSCIILYTGFPRIVVVVHTVLWRLISATELNYGHPAVELSTLLQTRKSTIIKNTDVQLCHCTASNKNSGIKSEL